MLAHARQLTENLMALRIPFGVGLGVGYVLGARAGRQQYDSIARAFRAAKEQPAVQEAAGVVAARASALVGQVKQSAFGSRRTPAPPPRVTAASGPTPPPAPGGPTILSSPPGGQLG